MNTDHIQQTVVESWRDFRIIPEMPSDKLREVYDATRYDRNGEYDKEMIITLGRMCGA